MIRFFGSENLQPQMLGPSVALRWDDINLQTGKLAACVPRQGR
jgi:hypothetical protein